MGFDLGLVSLVGLGLVISGSVSQGLVSWVGRQVSELGCQLVGWVGGLVGQLASRFIVVGWLGVSQFVGQFRVSLGLVTHQLVRLVGQFRFSLGLVQGLVLGTWVGWQWDWVQVVYQVGLGLATSTCHHHPGCLDGLGWSGVHRQIELGQFGSTTTLNHPRNPTHPANLSKLTLTNQPTIPCEPPLQGRPSQGGVTSSPWSYFGATNVLGKLDMSNSWLKCLKTEISTLFLEYLPK